MPSPTADLEVRDVADGLWLWRQPHPDWIEGEGWLPEVASFAVESGGVTALLDPLAPPPGARAVWDRIEAMDPDRCDGRARATLHHFGLQEPGVFEEAIEEVLARA